ncbi:hypothetical protein O181_006151 [Austropuccinia psidii MF-1]|uniref:Reverse transcriptase Ty1/copia-type domain-containing protein n=1 Tax=Austropuccinia psidii MF-1 TaxID=1389203 RepID=A0A9Q3GGH8_9BASI|nr:hypothetical protein [Austropuccinia psidii MF-1]
MCSSEGDALDTAIKEEISNITNMCVFGISPLTPLQRVLPGGWPFAIKLDANGRTQYKAQYVARGNLQHPIFKYTHTFAPTSNFTSLRNLLVIASQRKWHVANFKFVAEYLNVPIHEELWILPPEGYGFRLRKALYGTRQAGRCWGECPTGHLISFTHLGESILLVNMSSNKIVNCLLLNSDNYFTWVTMMELELDNIGALDLILKTDHQAREIQETLNHKAYNLILQYLNEDNLSFVSSMLDQTNKRKGIELWKILKEKHISNNISSQTLAFTKFSQVKFDSNLEFIQEICITVSKMKLVGFKLEESTLIIMVLSKLPQELNSFVRLMSHGFRNKGLDFILKKLEQDHIQFKLNEDSFEATVALYSQRNKRYCNYCQKKSHLKEYCWKKYPERKPANFIAQFDEDEPSIEL